MTMSQRQQLERIMEIDRRIRAGEFPNADRMAEILEVSRRVIYNDRSSMICRLGAPIEYDRERGGWFYTDQTWILLGMMVTEGELLASIGWQIIYFSMDDHIKQLFEDRIKPKFKDRYAVFELTN